MYPAREPFRTGRLPVGHGHELAFEECGNPHGKPVVCLHGGPGAGRDPGERQLFDPAVYRIIAFDQRGCGQSTPHASVVANTTWDLVADLERLREALGIERWQVFGGSWGSTLALAYAQQHPARVTELILRGVFLLRPAELAWFYRSGASHLLPERWSELRAWIPAAEHDDLLAAYHCRLHGSDLELRLEAARRWCTWELAAATRAPDPQLLALADSPAFALALARIETHYFVHGAWLAEHPLLAHVDAIRHLPCTIVQGRYDLVCPPRSAFDLQRAWPEATLHLVEAEGHVGPEILATITRASDGYRGRR